METISFSGSDLFMWKYCHFNSLNARVAIIYIPVNLTCSANQLTGFDMMVTLVFNELTYMTNILRLFMVCKIISN